MGVSRHLGGLKFSRGKIRGSVRKSWQYYLMDFGFRYLCQGGDVGCHVLKLEN